MYKLMINYIISLNRDDVDKTVEEDCSICSIIWLYQSLPVSHVGAVVSPTNVSYWQQFWNVVLSKFLGLHTFCHSIRVTEMPDHSQWVGIEHADYKVCHRWFNWNLWSAILQLMAQFTFNINTDAFVGIWSQRKGSIWKTVSVRWLVIL